MCKNMAEVIDMPFLGMTCVGPRNHALYVIKITTERGTFEGRHAGELYVPMHGYIAPDEGDCPCPVHEADECIRRHMG